MKTTIDIREPLLEQAQGIATDRGVQLADVVNDALREAFNHSEQRTETTTTTTKPYRVIVFGMGGLRPGIDLDDNGSVQEAMDEEFRNEDGSLDYTRMR